MLTLLHASYELAGINLPPPGGFFTPSLRTGMDTQQLLNLLFAAIGFGGAWWINTIWNKIQDLQTQLAQTNLKLAEGYVPRAELEKTFERLFDAIDEIKKEITHMSRNQASLRAYNELLGKGQQ